MDWQQVLKNVLKNGDLVHTVVIVFGDLVVDVEGSAPVFRNISQEGDTKEFTVFFSAFGAQMQLDRMRDMDPALAEFGIMPTFEFAYKAINKLTVYNKAINA